MVKIIKKKTIPFNFSDKHKNYIKKCRTNTYNFAEGAVRAGKTVDNVYAFTNELKFTKDKIHLATGSTSSNAKLNIGDANGFGLEYLFRGQCKWGKYKGNECLIIKGSSTKNKTKIVIFAGGAKADSYKKIRGNSYGMWIATEINLHHDNTIKEAFNRTIAAENRKIFWDLNPDNPNASIYKNYIDKYAKQDKEGKLLGGYNYEHFTIHDNISVTERRKQEVISQYDINSVWYQRDILGRRCVAEGLIYRKIADNPNKYIIKKEEIPKSIKIIIGVDFGGNLSGHAFVATGITRDYRTLYGLASERHFGDIDAKELSRLFVEFVKKIIKLYGYVDLCYADSAEQVLIRTLQNALYSADINLYIDNAWKSTILSRIRALNILSTQRRVFFTDDCETLIDAICTAIYNPKNLTEDERLDDNSSDIDSLDSFEYTFERDIQLLTMLEDEK